VEFTGFLEDIAEAYAGAALVVCPIKAGSGTRVKICEAAAFGRAIVSTHVGAEGLDFMDGKHIALADDVESFSSACIELMTNRRRAMELGANARALAMARYDRRRLVDEATSLVQATTARE
jgi:glycosyltransferase involved in cell wall biosynthesis